MFVSAQYKDLTFDNMFAIPARHPAPAFPNHVDVEVAVASKRFAIASVCVAVVVGVFLYPKAPAQKKKPLSSGMAVDPLAARPTAQRELGPLPPPGEGRVAQAAGQH
jgi:hypothetical protein